MNCNDWDYYPPVMLTCSCGFCGFQWCIGAMSAAIVLDCPDCDHMARVGDLVTIEGCDGEPAPMVLR